MDADGFSTEHQLNIIYIYGWMDAFGCVHTPDGFSTEIWMDGYTRVWHQMGVSTEQHIYGWIHSCVHTSDGFSAEQHTYDTWIDSGVYAHQMGVNRTVYIHGWIHSCVHTPDEMGFQMNSIHIWMDAPMGFSTEHHMCMDGYMCVYTHQIRWGF